MLVEALQLCFCKFSDWQAKMEEEEGGETPEVMVSVEEILQSLVDRMAKSEPEDFELDKSSDFSHGSCVGQKNRALAGLVMGVYEACDCHVT